MKRFQQEFVPENIGFSSALPWTKTRIPTSKTAEMGDAKWRKREICDQKNKPLEMPRRESDSLGCDSRKQEDEDPN